MQYYFFYQWGQPEKFYRLARKLTPIFGILAWVCIAYGIVAGLWWAPADYQQGDGFRIIYVHVPCAFWSLGIYSFMAMCSAVVLIWRIKVMESLAACAAPIGAMFTLLALITGAIWGKPMWGTWWVWDARLTCELILLFLYLGYMALHQSIQDKRVASKACAILALVGFVDIPIIHFSVKWWNTLHQGTTLSPFGNQIHTDMLFPLLSMVIGFGLYFANCLLLNVQRDLLERESNARWVKQEMSELLK